MRHEKEAHKPEPWQMEKMRKLCEEYADNRERIEDLDVRLDEYEDMKQQTSPWDWPLIERYVAEDRARRANLLRQVLFFESALARIGGRTADILRQIYGKKIPWHAVEDRMGIRLQPSTIARERRKGLEMMCGMYDWTEDSSG